MSRIVLVLASSSHPDEEQSRKDCIETAPFWSEAKFASLLLKTARITQQNGWKICAEIGFSKNFAQTENKPEIFARGTRSPRRPNFTVWSHTVGNKQRIYYFNLYIVLNCEFSAQSYLGHLNFPVQDEKLPVWQSTNFPVWSKLEDPHNTTYVGGGCLRPGQWPGHGRGRPELLAGAFPELFHLFCRPRPAPAIF